jgi:hypothetical protein
MITAGQEAEVQAISRALRDGKLVPVIGAGVSSATIGLPNWTGIVTSALNHAEKTTYGTKSSELAEARLALAANNLTAAARIAKKLLGAPVGEYPAWLKTEFDTTGHVLKTNEVIDRIVDLRAPLLATTNYDKILSDRLYTRPPAVSWLHPVKMQTVLKESGNVLHLHGVFDEPESAIFGADDYDKIVSAAPYQAVQRVLWLDRTMLFIGCSFDGLDDPDFGSLLKWAAANFAGTPHKHYALMRAGSFDAQKAADLLKDYRIQVISYGPDYSHLPRAIEQLNNDVRLSAKMRWEYAFNTLVLNDPSKAGEVAEALKGFVRTAYDDPSLDQKFVELASNLLETQKKTNSELKEQLRSFQSVAKSIISIEQLGELHERWLREKAALYSGSYQEVVDRAYGLLKLLKLDFLTELRQRQIPIHNYWMTGHLQREYAFLKMPAPVDDYGVENANRILSSLRAVLAANPDEIFAEPTPEPTKPNLKGRFVLLARSSHLEIRHVNSPELVAASLPLGQLPVRHAEPVTIRGETTIAAHDDQKIFLWDPRKAGTPYEEWRPPVDLGESISDVFHSQLTTGLRSVAVLDGGTVIELLNFVESTRYSIDKYITSPIGLAHVPDRFFAVLGGLASTAIVGIKREDGPPETVFSIENCDAFIRGHPILSAKFNQRKEFFKNKGTPSSSLAMMYQNLGLKKGRLNSKDILMLRVTIWYTLSHRDELLIFIDPSDKIALKGYFYLEDAQTVAYGEYVGESQIIGLLRTHGPQNSVISAKGLATPEGIIFSRDKSAWEHDRDIYSIAIWPDVGFASDDMGALYKIDVGRFEVSPTAIDKSSYINSLKLFEL